MAIPARAADTDKLNGDLVYVSSLGRSNAVDLLLQQGASINAKSNNGVPLLSLAAARKDKEGLAVVRTLLAHGAAVDTPDADGQTPLFYAARAGNNDIITFLLQQHANYYAIDKKGDVARNVAFRENHQDSVDLMDNFVRAQSRDVMQQYQDYNQLLQQRYKEMQASGQPAPVQNPDAPEPPPVAIPVVTTPSASNPPAPQPPAKPAYNAERLQMLVTQLSLSSCAYQYWSFCRDAEAHTEFTPGALDDIIETERSSMITQGDTLINEFGVDTGYVNKIIDPSKQQVYTQLNHMPSNGYRREKGIGTKVDMQQRCTRFARNWQIAAPGASGTLDVEALTPQAEEPAKGTANGNTGANAHNAANRSYHASPNGGN